MATARSPIETTVTAASTKSPAGAVILTHGRGADAGDLEPLLSILDPDRRLPRLLPRRPPPPPRPPAPRHLPPRPALASSGRATLVHRPRGRLPGRGHLPADLRGAVRAP